MAKMAKMAKTAKLRFLERALLLLTCLMSKQIKIETHELSQIKEQTFAIRLSILQVIFEAINIWPREAIPPFLAFWVLVSPLSLF